MESSKAYELEKVLRETKQGHCLDEPVPHS